MYLQLRQTINENEIIIEGTLLKLITLKVTETYQHMEALSAITQSAKLFSDYGWKYKEVLSQTLMLL